MSWEAIQAIAELTGAAAVLASLVYLAIQVRQNTASVQAGTVARSSEALNRIRAEIWSDAETTRIYLLALSGEEIEDVVTATRTRLFFVTLARDYEAIYYQNEAGQLPDSMWETWLREMMIIFSTPGGHDALLAMEHDFLDAHFVRFLKAELAASGKPLLTDLVTKWTEIGAARRANAPGAPQEEV